MIMSMLLLGRIKRGNSVALNEHVILIRRGAAHSDSLDE